MVWHTDKVERYNGSLEELGLDISRLSFNDLSDFLDEMGEDLEIQGRGDDKRGRCQLSTCLYDAAFYVMEASDLISYSSGFDMGLKSNLFDKYKGNLRSLANDVGFMTYDKTSFVIGKIGDELMKQSFSEEGDISKSLFLSAESIYDCKDEIDKAWKICIPYMK